MLNYDEWLDRVDIILKQKENVSLDLFYKDISQRLETLYHLEKDPREVVNYIVEYCLT